MFPLCILYVKTKHLNSSYALPVDMKPVKRRYVYKTTYNLIMDWAWKKDLKSPNNKENFPFYLEKYLEAHKQ